MMMVMVVQSGSAPDYELFLSFYQDKILGAIFRSKNAKGFATVTASINPLKKVEKPF